MATKQKPKSNTKSRISKNKLNKKVGIPRWAIAVVALVIAGVGIALIYNSFAAVGPNGPVYSTGTHPVYCNRGVCGLSPSAGSYIGQKPIGRGYSNSSCGTLTYYRDNYSSNKSPQWFCLNSL